MNLVEDCQVVRRQFAGRVGGYRKQPLSFGRVPRQYMGLAACSQRHRAIEQCYPRTVVLTEGESSLSVAQC